LYRDLAKFAGSKATWGEPKLTAALSVRRRDAWNADWARQYSDIPFDRVESFLARSKRTARNLMLLRWFGAAAAVQRVTALQAAQEGLVKDLNRRKQYQDLILNQIAQLSRSQGTTKELQESIAKEKADLEAQLSKSQQDSQKLASELRQSDDLLTTVNLLKGRLAAAEKDRDDEARKRQDAETKLAQLSQPATHPVPQPSVVRL
jgi:septal ring factor EnvC (AmiA/AmiB activator)